VAMQTVVYNARLRLGAEVVRMYLSSAAETVKAVDVLDCNEVRLFIR